jgi:hypothetical protein
MTTQLLISYQELIVDQPYDTMAARIAISLNLFEHIATCNRETITSKELAVITGGEEVLICTYPRSLKVAHD